MRPATRFSNLFHLHIRHIIPERPRPLPILNRIPHSRRHKLDVYLDAAYDFQIRIETCEEGCLALEVLAGRHSDAVENVGYSERIEFEAATCNSGCLVLPVERGSRMDDVLEVSTCSAEVGCGEL
jgi:hypothetical protein